MVLSLRQPSCLRPTCMEIDILYHGELVNYLLIKSTIVLYHCKSDKGF